MNRDGGRGGIVVGIQIPDLSSNSETWTQTSGDPLCSLPFELEQHCIFFVSVKERNIPYFYIMRIKVIDIL